MGDRNGRRDRNRGSARTANPMEPLVLACGRRARGVWRLVSDSYLFLPRLLATVPDRYAALGRAGNAQMVSPRFAWWVCPIHSRSDDLAGHLARDISLSVVRLDGRL